MAEPSVQESTERKRTRPLIVAPSQYLFTTDRLLEDPDLEEPVRVKNRFQWVLTNINFTVGLGPLWRFPIVAYYEAGGPFVVAYAVVFICVGYPLALMEVALGQCTRRRAATVFKLCTAFEGLSICMGLYCFLLPLYYNVIFAEAIYYFYHSFYTHLPWMTCDFTSSKRPGYECVAAGDNRSGGNLISAEEVFWQFGVLNGLEGQVPIQLNRHLVLCYAISWAIVSLFLVHKIRKYTFAMEYLLIPLVALGMVVVIVVNVMLGGSTRKDLISNSTEKFLTPTLSFFTDVQVWREATQQVLFSLGIASGPLITLGSLSHFKSPVHVDSAVVCGINFVFSFVAGIAVYYGAEIVAGEINKNTAVVQNTELYGSGVFFIAFSRVLGELPAPQFWSVMFFALLFIVGSRAVMGSIDTTVSVVRYFVPLGHRRRFKVEYAALIVVVCSFLIGLAVIIKGDTYVFFVLNHFGGGTSLPAIAFFEAIAVIWFYGVARFSGDVEFMLDYKPNVLLRVIWVAIPIYLMVLIIASWLHEWILFGTSNGVTLVPWPVELCGWLLVLFILLPLPVRFVVNFVELSRKKRLKEIFKSRDDAGPDDLELWFRDDQFFDRMSVRMPP